MDQFLLPIEQRTVGYRDQAGGDFVVVRNSDGSSGANADQFNIQTQTFIDRPSLILVQPTALRTRTILMRAPRQNGIDRASRVLRAASLLGYVAALVLMPAVGSTVEYDVRNFDSSAHLYRRTGPDLVPLMTSPGDRFFMGAHVRLEAFVTDQPSAIVTVAASTVGNNRYIRLQTADNSGELEIQTRTDGQGSGGNSFNLSVGVPLEFGQWYATGVLVEVGQSGWNFTVYVRPHGGDLETASGAAETLSFPTLDLYSVARHAYVKSTGGSVVSAHNLRGDAASPIFVEAPTDQEILDFMSLVDPNSSWSPGDYLAQPDMATAIDPVDQEEWVIAKPLDSRLNGTLTLPEPRPGLLSFVAIGVVTALATRRRSAR
jgi:hypothetical protein